MSKTLDVRGRCMRGGRGEGKEEASLAIILRKILQNQLINFDGCKVWPAVVAKDAWLSLSKQRIRHQAFGMRVSPAKISLVFSLTWTLNPEHFPQKIFPHRRQWCWKQKWEFQLLPKRVFRNIGGKNFGGLPHRKWSQKITHNSNISRSLSYLDGLTLKHFSSISYMIMDQ